MTDNRFGTDPHELVRTNDPDTSHEAAKVVDTATWEERVYWWVARQGLNGGTPTEARADHPDANYSTVGARFASLKRKGMIVPTGEVRDGSEVVIDARLTVKGIVPLDEPRKPTTKESHVAFFRWWYNQPGTNTEQGYDDWVSKGRPGPEGDSQQRALF